MKKSFMNNIKHFVDSNVRQRIDRAANNNNDFFGDDLLLVERQFEDMRHVCVESEKRISAMLQSLASSPLGAYTQNVQASLNNLSTNLSAVSHSATATTLTSLSASTSTNCSSTHQTIVNQATKSATQTTSPAIDMQFPTTYRNKQPNQSSCRIKTSSVSNTKESLRAPSTTNTTPTSGPMACNRGSTNQLHTSQSGLNDATVIRQDIRRHKKLPIVGFLKFLVKSCYKLRPDSLLATTLTHCSQLQTQLTELYLDYEQTIELQCLKPIQHIIENDVPNVIKLRKLFIKSHNDLESVKAKYNGASQKQQQLQQSHTSHSTSTSYTITQSSVQQANINKLDQLRKELDDAMTRFEQARDIYATELYAFVCRETELVNLFMKFYQYQAEYQLQVGSVIQNSLPSLSNILATTPRKLVFGTPLEEHLRCTGRSVSLVIELCVHILYSKGLDEEGLFRIPGSSIKIKKLKNAINAWFVTLASQSELDNDQQRTHSSVLAVHDLFKEVAGQRPQQAQLSGDIITNNQTNSSARDDSASTQISVPSPNYQHDLVFDIHTIAGLLKLYLRELPEPLFTFALYQQFLNATAKAVNDNQPKALEQTIQQLPKANYDNLHHLIRFLHLLTCHSESNKMTATNLAITMAPSLIWARPSNNHQYEQQTPGGEQGQEDLQALNLQMTSVGMSASLHALVIENLINNAEKLFPGSTHFSIVSLEEASAELCTKIQQLSTQDRCIESSSPTGLSTASSSSYSSNNSLASSKIKKHSRKGGSMEGLLSHIGKSVHAIRQPDTTRPYSVQLNQGELPQGQSPPIPPAPAARSHMKPVSDSTTTTLRPATSHKSPAPPIPPFNSKRQQYITGSSNLEDKTVDGSKTFSSLVQSALDSSKGSFRGASASSSTSAGVHTTLRPTVPPPNRPLGTSPDNKTYSQFIENRGLVNKADDNDNSTQNEGKIFNGLAIGCNFRADFEEISAIDVDDISAPSVSPVVSLDDTISGDDSSFDNECHSIEHSWTDCDSECVNQVGNSTDIISKKHGQRGGVNNQESKVMTERIDGQQAEQGVTSELIQGDSADGSPNAPSPPVKPPRSISPRVTQSTPL